MEIHKRGPRSVLNYDLASVVELPPRPLRGGSRHGEDVKIFTEILKKVLTNRTEYTIIITESKGNTPKSIHTKEQ